LGSKIAGFYTVRQWSSLFNIGQTVRAPTKAERDKEYWWVHGESKHNNAWTPNRWFRKNRMKQNRMITKAEIMSFWKNPEYEVCCEDNPRSHIWDWS